VANRAYRFSGQAHDNRIQSDQITRTSRANDQHHLATTDRRGSQAFVLRLDDSSPRRGPDVAFQRSLVRDAGCDKNLKNMTTPIPEGTLFNLQAAFPTLKSGHVAFLASILPSEASCVADLGRRILDAGKHAGGRPATTGTNSEDFRTSADE
jgi:hypothetical protein